MSVKNLHFTDIVDAMNNKWTVILWYKVTPEKTLQKREIIHLFAGN